MFFKQHSSICGTEASFQTSKIDNSFSKSKYNLPERNSTSSCDLEKNPVEAKVLLIFVSVSTSEINAGKELSDQAVKGFKVLKYAPFR